jgi:predicted sulfurtransferase
MPEPIHELVGFIQSYLSGRGDVEVKYSSSGGPCFRHMRVKVKDEIVTMGCPNICGFLVYFTVYKVGFIV